MRSFRTMMALAMTLLGVSIFPRDAFACTDFSGKWNLKSGDSTWLERTFEQLGCDSIARVGDYPPGGRENYIIDGKSHRFNSYSAYVADWRSPTRLEIIRTYDNHSEEWEARENIAFWKGNDGFRHMGFGTTYHYPDGHVTNGGFYFFGILK